MRAHDIEYRIIGHDMQLVEIVLDPGETVIAEAGAMTYMEAAISFETRMGDGADPEEGMFGKLFSAGKRMLTGESLFTTHFTNGASAGKSRVAFSAPYPGTVMPLALSQLGGKVICQKDAFLCAARGTKLGIAFNKRLGSGLFGGEGFILQKLEGDGLAFIQAGGTVIEKTLNNETLRVDTGCLVGFTEGIEYDIGMSGGLKSMLFGGEGVFLATLSGSGKVWIQSLPFSRMADRILQHAPQGGGKERGED
ncbi:MAG: TIGR00266 family protein [Candidatus Thiodiazotropha sp.]